MSGARRRRSHDPARNMQTDGALKAQMIIRKARSLHVWHPVSILSLSDVRVGLHRDDKSEAVLFPLSDLPRFHIDDEVLGLDWSDPIQEKIDLIVNHQAGIVQENVHRAADGRVYQHAGIGPVGAGAI